MPARESLPKPCDQCREYDGRWRMTDRGLRRCKCPRGVALQGKHPQEPANSSEPRISEEAAAQAVRAMADIPYFPSSKEEEARTLIADDLMSMCHNVTELRWIVHRMRALFDRWPGSRTMRIVFCQKHHPLDGVDLGSAISETFPDGVPPEKPIPEQSMMALPPGQVTADPELQSAVEQLAREKAMPPARRESSASAALRAGE